MAAKLLVTVEAHQDGLEAYDWYEKQRVGLGEDFLDCVDSCIQQILRNPEMYAKACDDYRRGMVRRFPYAVYYEFVADTVIIYAVFHTARDPAKWRARLP